MVSSDSDSWLAMRLAVCSLCSRVVSESDGLSTLDEADLSAKVTWETESRYGLKIIEIIEDRHLFRDTIWGVLSFSDVGGRGVQKYQIREGV